MKRPYRKEKVVTENPGPCPDCIHYNACEAPCDKVERWINQDCVGVLSDKVVLENGQVKEKIFIRGAPDDYLDIIGLYNGRESWVDERDGEIARKAWEEFKSLKLSPKTVEFVDLYYRQGKRIRDIAIELGITSSAADRRHQQAKASIKRRMRRKHIWENILSTDFKFSNNLHFDICRLVFGEYMLQREAASALKVHPAQVSKVVSGVMRKLIDRGLIEDTGRRI